MSRTVQPTPSSLFFSTPAQKAALARERFFEAGMRPEGLVDDAVLQSWSRCAAAGMHTRDPVRAEPISRLRLQTALRRSHELREAAACGMARLEGALSGTANRVILTNADGVIIRTGQSAPQVEEVALRTLGQVGIDLSEGSLGTTAPGIVAATGKGCSVLANEHFNDTILTMRCAAAPIHDVDGRLAGVLDVSVEGRGFGFDAYTLISSYACDIENTLLQLQSRDMLVLRFHAEPMLLGTPLAGLAGIDSDGVVRWINGLGSQLTGGRRGDTAHEVFGQTLTGLAALLRQQAATPLQLPNGLTLWFEATLKASDGAVGRVHAAQHGAASPTHAAQTLLHEAAPGFAEGARTLAAATATATADLSASVPTPGPPMKLEDAHALSIDKALASTAGNVAAAARTLGVSRGVIYRHLRKRTDVTGQH